MAGIPTIEPFQIRAGDTAKWQKTLPEYPSSEWQLQYTIYNTNYFYTVTATPQDDGSFLITIPASQTSQYATGEYKWICRVSKNEETYTVDSGTIEILPNPISETDERSHIKKVLDAIERVMEGRATRTDLEYQIGDKRLRSMSIEELYTAWRKYKLMYEQELQAERLKKGVGITRLVKTRFV